MDILLITDDPDLGAMLRTWFGAKGHNVDINNPIAFNNDPRAWEKRDLVLTAPSSIAAYDIPRRFKTSFPLLRIPLVMIGPDPIAARRVKDIIVAADEYCDIPFEMEELQAAIESAMDSTRRRIERNVCLSIKMALQSDLRKLENCRDFFTTILRKSPLPDEAQWDLQMIIEELAANSIEHGNRFDPRRIVVIELELQDSLAKLTIEDEGEGFDFKRQLESTREINDHGARGRGLFLVANIAGKLDFQLDGRRVYVEFSPSQPSPEPK